MQRIVTIDGPAGAGKSTIASRLARQLGWELLDTGAMYRALTLAALDAKIDLENQQALTELAEGIDVQVLGQQVRLNGQDVSALIRKPEVTTATRHLANHSGVRRRLVELQRRFAIEHDGIVTEGRDQGTVVFPNAACKFFLIADLTERARRRHRELTESGHETTLEQVQEEIARRDEQDQDRAVGPLRKAEDALVIETTGRTIDQVADDLLAHCRSRFPENDDG